MGPLIYSQQIIRDGSSTFDFWYWIENPQDFVNIDLATVSHGFEHSEVGFYDPRKLESPVRPLRMTELIDIWNIEGPIFVQELDH